MSVGGAVVRWIIIGTVLVKTPVLVKYPWNVRVPSS